MWPSVLFLGLAAATSLVGYLLLPLPSSTRPSLGRAVLLTLEIVGISSLFLAGNLLLGVTIVVGVRTISPHFVSVYVLNDLSLVALSILQGAVFFCWRRGRPD